MHDSSFFKSLNHGFMLQGFNSVSIIHEYMKFSSYKLLLFSIDIVHLKYKCNISDGASESRLHIKYIRTNLVKCGLVEIRVPNVEILLVL